MRALVRSFPALALPGSARSPDWGFVLAILARLGRSLVGLVPPLVSLVLILGIWQLVSDQPGSALPTPPISISAATMASQERPMPIFSPVNM